MPTRRGVSRDVESKIAFSIGAQVPCDGRMKSMLAKRLSRLSLCLGLIALLGAAACEDVELTLPTEAEARAHYESATDLRFRMSGNVLEIFVNQPLQQVRRGGALWAKVGPYIYLFAEETETLLRRFPGLSGVRVITQTSRRDTEVARAFLGRQELNELTWRRSKNIAGKARLDGTRRPSYLEDLVEWGEEHTEFQYSDEFTGR